MFINFTFKAAFLANNSAIELVPLFGIPILSNDYRSCFSNWSNSLKFEGKEVEILVFDPFYFLSISIPPLSVFKGFCLEITC